MRFTELTYFQIWVLYSYVVTIFGSSSCAQQSSKSMLARSLSSLVAMACLLVAVELFCKTRNDIV